MPFGYFSKDIAFASHFVASCLLPSSHPVGVLVVLVIPVNNLSVNLKDHIHRKGGGMYQDDILKDG